MKRYITYNEKEMDQLILDLEIIRKRFIVLQDKLKFASSKTEGLYLDAVYQLLNIHDRLSSKE